MQLLLLVEIGKDQLISLKGIGDVSFLLRQSDVWCTLYMYTHTHTYILAGIPGVAQVNRSLHSMSVGRQ